MKAIKEKLKQASERTFTTLFWTGGYDSTFRLLQLLLVEKKKVQPIYIIDLSHRSPVHELLSMDEIRRALNQRGGGAAALLQPTLYIDKDEITYDEQILKAWSRINQEKHIGRQYIWLASLCKQYDLQEVELSIEKDSEDSASESIACYLVEGKMTPDIQTVFKHFSLPIIDMTRKDMQRIVKREGWSGFMKRTWFCHHPIYHPFKKGIPCGICNPCRVAIEEGFGYRIPFLLRHSGKYLKKMYNSSIMGIFK